MNIVPVQKFRDGNFSPIVLAAPIGHNAPMMLPRPIFNAIDKIARTAMGKDWNLYATLIDRWSEIVGPDYAKQTSPVKIIFPKGKKPASAWADGRQTDGTLYIRLPQGLAMEFSFQSEVIRARINGFFGYPAIGRLAYEPFYPTGDDGPHTEPPRPLSEADRTQVTTQTKDIENDELRTALEHLGESVLTKRGDR